MIATQIQEDAFTADLVKQNENLKDLSDDQIADIVKLGNNVVKDRIRAKTADFYAGIDKDVEEVSGLQKNTDERTYDYVKRAIKSGSKELSGQLSELKQAKADLEAKVKDGNVTEAIKAQITDLEKQIKDKAKEVSDWKEKHSKDLSDLTQKLTAAEEKNLKIRVDYQMSEALSGFKFLDEAKLPKVARDATINAAKMSVLAEFKPDFVDDGKGGEKLVWRNAAGEIATNPGNKLEPFTTAELIAKHLDPIIDKGRVIQGSGGKAPASAGPNGGQFLLNGAKTQVEADEQILQFLISNGVDRRSKDFDKQMAEIREANDVSKLPVK